MRTIPIGIIKPSLILCPMLIIMFTNSVSSQVFEKTFDGLLKDYGRSVLQTADNGYVIFGYTESFGAGLQDILIVKTNSSGDIQWVKTHGGAMDEGSGGNILQLASGEFIVCAGTESYGAGSRDICLIKLDTSGDTLWTRTYGNSNYDYPSTVLQTADEGFIICGITFSSPTNLYMIKVDSNGNLLWNKTYIELDGDVTNSIDALADGGFIVTGFTFSGGVTNYLLKIDLLGSVVWHKAFLGISGNGYKIHVTSDNGYIITGNTNGFGAGESDMYLIKTDVFGDTMWTRTFGGTGMDVAYDVQQTVDGGYIVVGYTESFGSGLRSVYSVRTNGNGDTLWTRTYGQNLEEGLSVEQTSDGGFVITGFTFDTLTSNMDGLLIKTDENGNTGCDNGGTNTIVGHMSFSDTSYTITLGSNVQ